MVSIRERRGEMDEVWMQNLTWEKVAEHLEGDDIVMVPIGSTESHGPHLPLGTDSYEAIDYAEGIARRAGVLCAPPIWFGNSAHHMHKPGTITLRGETEIALLEDVYRSLIHHGFGKIITFNGHRLANLSCIEIACQAVKGTFPEVVFAVMDPLLIGREVSLDIQEAPGEGVHGGELETSHMLYAHPELVNMDRAMRAPLDPFPSRLVPQSKDPLAGGDRVLLVGGAADQRRLAPLGHVGDPTAATREKGERLFETIVENGAEFIEDLRKAARAREGEGTA
jgi:creatinine amidohydrolase